MLKKDKEHIKDQLVSENNKLLDLQKKIQTKKDEKKALEQPLHDKKREVEQLQNRVGWIMSNYKTLTTEYTDITFKKKTVDT